MCISFQSTRRWLHKINLVVGLECLAIQMGLGNLAKRCLFEFRSAECLLAKRKIAETPIDRNHLTECQTPEFRIATNHLADIYLAKCQMAKNLSDECRMDVNRLAEC